MSSDLDAKCLETFPAWLRTLGEDAEGIVELVSTDTVPEPAKRALAGGVNYLFKSLDLIPDGIDDIGYLDDAFVLRVAAAQASKEDLSKVSTDKLKTCAKLSNEAEIVEQFLGQDYARLDTYVQGLRRGSARARSVDDIVANASVLADFVSDVRGFARSYTSPSFAREQKNLIKLRAFFDAKLPR